jgi:thymidylate kinase
VAPLSCRALRRRRRRLTLEAETAIKVAFIGSHGVGKTTLCYELAAQLKRHGVNADMVKEVARLSPLPINRKTSLDAQTWILMTQIAEEIRSASQADVVVCDRSVLDNYAYMVLACGRQRWLERVINQWIKTYDLLFKVPIAGAPAADGVRDTDEFFMRSIDQLVDALLLEKGIAHEKLPAGERESWIAIVSERVLTSPQLSKLF